VGLRASSSRAAKKKNEEKISWRTWGQNQSQRTSPLAPANRNRARKRGAISCNPTTGGVKEKEMGGDERVGEGKGKKKKKNRKRNGLGGHGAARHKGGRGRSGRGALREKRKRSRLRGAIAIGLREGSGGPNSGKGKKVLERCPPSEERGTLEIEPTTPKIKDLDLRIRKNRDTLGEVEGEGVNT